MLEIWGKVERMHGVQERQIRHDKWGGKQRHNRDFTNLTAQGEMPAGSFPDSHNLFDMSSWNYRVLYGGAGFLLSTSHCAASFLVSMIGYCNSSSSVRHN